MVLIKKISDILNKMEAKTTNCQNCKKEFLIDSEDFNFYTKIKVPPPTFCVDCRRIRRWAWRNNMSLYSRKCELCDKAVISIYSPESGITVYCNKCWWSDNWDPKSYGVDYDFSKPFFAQIAELTKRVPHMAIVNDDGIASLNCEYTHDWWFSKNCYMCLSGWRTENVMYSYFILSGKDIVDSSNLISKNEFLYETMRASGSYRVKYSQFVKTCVDSSFLYYCRDCFDCFMCSNIVSKKYYFKNKEYSKEEYEKILASYHLDTYEGVERAKKEFEEFLKTEPKRYASTIQVVNSSGDNMSTSKNSKYVFVAKDMENCRYCDFVSKNKDSYDLTMTGEVSECYESVTADHSQLNLFGLFSVKSQDMRYTQHCNNGKHLFGCIGLRNGKYSILNKEYSKEEYEMLVEKIIKHMNEMPYVDNIGNVYKYGEYYPAEFSYYGYNETNISELLPLTKEEAVKKGYKWQDNIQKTTGKETLKPDQIPQSIHDVDESILNEVLVCTSCDRNYKLVPNELIFYKKMEIPIPRRCFFCRHNDRMKLRQPFKLWKQSCMCNKENHEHKGKCSTEFETTYSPERPEIVYCHTCFQAETI